MRGYKSSIRTDLAVEAREILEEEQEDFNDGIEIESKDDDEIKTTYVKITNEKGSKSMGKPTGTYITIESRKLREDDNICHENISKKLETCLLEMIDSKKNAVFLVVGLGNWHVTPDALGPKVIDKILVTRHMLGTLPESMVSSVRSLAAIAPGVMGITGIETGEIIKGLVDKLKPDAVIAIDALAARKFSRINATIQLSDTGISPGAGVGNKRMMLSKETLGVPVVAIGVPTVVDAATLASDTIDMVLSHLKSSSDEVFYKVLEDMEDEDRYSLVCEALDPYGQNMFVTPKEIDMVIERLSKIIAGAINSAIHPGVEIADLGRYTN